MESEFWNLAKSSGGMGDTRAPSGGPAFDDFWTVRYEVHTPTSAMTGGRSASRGKRRAIHYCHDAIRYCFQGRLARDDPSRCATQGELEKDCITS